MTSAEIAAELTELQELLELEKEADLEFHRQKILNLPLDKRVSEGYSWYNVTVTKSGYTIGDRAFVIIERPQPHKPDQFRAGNMVNFFTRQPNVHKPERGGVIQFAERSRMKIILNTADLPEWIGLGLLGVDLLFDDRTYREMAKAVTAVQKARGNRLAELRDIILGKQAAQFREVNEFLRSEQLNDSQNAAMRDVIGSYELTVIHGPPGTGKTTTLVQTVKQLLQAEPTVLLCAPSNTAVDLLTERVAAEGINVLRIGNISRVDDDVLSHTLDFQVANHPDAKTIKKLKVQAAELRRKAKRFRRNFGAEERKQRGAMFKEAGEVSGWANQLEQRLIDQLLEGARVITCTLVGAANSLLTKRHFRTVIIDEAAQALEPATWIPILKAGRVVLTGDPFQLPPTIKSHAARRKGLEVTLIEKALKRQARTSLLRTQYRMNELIMNFSNQQFYDGRLLADDSVKNRTLAKDPYTPVEFIDTAGTDFEEQVQPQFQSRYNEGEFQILCEHLYALLEHCDTHEVRPLPSIALISPYREQVVQMKQSVKQDGKATGCAAHN